MMSAPRQDEKEPRPLDDDAMIGKEENLLVGVQNQRNESQNAHFAASPYEAVRAPPPAPGKEWEWDAHAPRGGSTGGAGEAPAPSTAGAPWRNRGVERGGEVENRRKNEEIEEEEEISPPFNPILDPPLHAPSPSPPPPHVRFPMPPPPPTYGGPPPPAPHFHFPMAPNYGGPPPPPPHISFQYNSAATIERIPYSFQFIVPMNRSVIGPTAVAIGPYHHGAPQLAGMEDAKSVAVEGFCRAAGRSREAVRAEMLSVAAAARRSYAVDGTLASMDAGAFADMMLLDGCFLLQFMLSMCPRRPGGGGGPPPPAADDALMSRGEVRRSINAIARDVMLLENQIPWPVLSSLMQLMTPPPQDVVDRFLALMSSAFHIVGNINKQNANSTQTTQLRAAARAGEPIDQAAPPPHLLGLFHRRHMEIMAAVGTHQEQQQQGLLRIPIHLASLSSTAVELAEMGVKLAASKTKTFGDMAMTKRRRFGLFGELSLTPLVLNRLTECWLLNMAAYESCQLQLQQGAAADSFPVSSYVNLMSLLVNRPEDVQAMRAKGLVVSAFDDRETLGFFKALAPQLNVGDRYYDVFQQIQQYKQERWLWIPIHRFFYKNFKTIVTVFSIIGVLAGLFKTILSVKQPHG